MTPEKSSNSTSGKNMRYYMRFLHNNIGFLISGLVIIYCLSGIVQTYRDSDVFKTLTVHEKRLVAGLTETQLKDSLKLKNLKVTRSEANVLYFKEGTYNSATGYANYQTKENYAWMTPFTELHKTASKKTAHYFTLIFAVLLLFLSISAFWMFKPGTKLFSRGVIMTVIGIVASVLLLLM